MKKYRVMVPEQVVESGFGSRTDAQRCIANRSRPGSTYAGVDLFIEEYEEED